MSAPEHGTRSRYVTRQCRCGPCRQANADYARNRRLQPSGLVDARAVVEHLQALIAAGIGTRRIATQSGVARSAVHALLGENRPRCREETAAALLAVRADLAGCAVVPADAANEAVAALRARGWSLGAIAASVGRARVNPRAHFVTAETDRRLRRLARSAGCDPGTGTVERAEAAGVGTPPLPGR
jgi:hypothetical protein